MTTPFGQPLNRVDGLAKVTGAAKYAGEYDLPNLAYGWVVSSAIARGRIARIDATEALKIEGVLQVFTHENAPRLAFSDRSHRDEIAPPGSPFRPLHDGEVHFSGQPIALVVAQTLEIARYAAALVSVQYQKTDHVTDFFAARDKAYKPREPRGKLGVVAEPRGDAEKAFANAAIRHEAEYFHSMEHHNAIEMFASTAVWDDGKVTVYEKTQGAQNNQGYVAGVFGLDKNEVRVISPYVGGAYGSGLRPQYQLMLAVLAARALKRPVRVTLTRQQMFTIGYRPATVQRVALAANPDGKLTAIMHDAIGATSRYEDYQENDVNWAGVLYDCDATKYSYRLLKLDLQTPIDMRAPGGATGMYALESAMDELGYKVGMDPVELRLKNYSEKDQDKNLPFSSNELRACYRQGADRFGWSRRNPEPRSMRKNGKLIGWGMASGIWESMQRKASAQAVLGADGKLVVTSATADIGTGTYTIMCQVAADRLGLSIQNVRFELGDSSFPNAPVEGGSFTAATVGSAVAAVCDKMREKLFQIAKQPERSPFTGLQLSEIRFADGQIRSLADPARAIAVADVLRSARMDKIECTATAAESEEQKRHAGYAHSAVFCEVQVDEEFGTVEVTRLLNAIAAGRIINPKTARSQIIGGVVFGIGMALEEESVIDHKLGRIMNHDLAEYHIAVNADVPEIEVIFIEEHDRIINPIGVKGVGEIGVVGAAAAIANAVFHATGKRVRDLPITLDKLL